MQISRKNKLDKCIMFKIIKLYKNVLTIKEKLTK